MKIRPCLQPLEDRLAPTADLRATNVKFDFNAAVPGMTGHVTFTVENVGDTDYTASNYHIEVFFNPDNNFSINDFYRCIRRVDLSTPGGVVPAGKSFVVTHDVQFDPVEVSPAYGGPYVYPTTGENLWVLVNNVNDGLGKGDHTFDYSFGFGDIPDGKKVKNLPLMVSTDQYPDAKHAAALTLTKGTGQLAYSSGNINFSLTNTTAASIVGDQNVGNLANGLKIHDVTADSVVGDFGLKDATVTGSLAFTAGLGSLELLDLHGGSTLADLNVATGFGKPARLTLGSVTDANVTVTEGIASLTVGDWTNDNPNAANTVGAPFINKLVAEPPKGGTSGGDFEANLALLGPAPADGDGLGTATIAGSVGNAVWTVGSGGTPLNVGKVTVEGDAVNWQMSATGSVAGVTVNGNVNNSSLSSSTPWLKATSLGTIVVAHDLNAGVIRATGADASGVGIKQLAVGTVTQLNNLRADGGGIKNLGAVGWDAATVVTAPWIDSVACAGDFAPALDVSGARPGGNDTSIRSVKVGGKLTGLMDVFADVDSVSAGGTFNWAFTGGQGTGSPGTLLGKLQVTGAVSYSSIDTQVVGSMHLGSWDHGSLNLRLAGGSTKKVQIDGDVTDTQVNAPPDYGIGTLQARSWSSTTASAVNITAGTLGRLRVGQNDQGVSLKGVNVSMSGSFRGLGLGQVLADGQIDNCKFNVTHSIGAFAAGKLTNSQVTAGEAIVGLTVGGQPGATGPGFDQTTISAATLGKVKLYDVNTASGTAYGLTAGKVLDYTRYAAGRVVVAKKDLTQAGVEDQAGAYSLTIT